jgi:hypothetical protein
MPGKQRYIRSIDIPLAGAFDAGADPAGTAAIAPPVQAAIGAPTSLTLSTAIERDAVTPTAQIGATWLPPAGVAPSSYLVQWSLSSAFPDPGTTGQAANGEATTIRTLTPNTTYYVRVAAIAANVQGDWSATVSQLTASDTTPPAAPSSQAASFAGGGDLVITWTNPTSANFKDTEIGIYSDASKTTTYATIFNATGRYVWTVAQNLAATSGAGDPTVYVELRARSWGNIFSTAVNTGLITKSAPSAPTVTLLGFSQLLTCMVTSAPESATSLFEYVWKRDGATVQTDLIADTQDTYAVGAVGDEGSHSWTCVVRQRDAFGQYSSTTTSSAVVLDTLTIAYLRAGLIYSDSISTALSALAVLKDGVTASGGVAYAA